MPAATQIHLQTVQAAASALPSHVAPTLPPTLLATDPAAPGLRNMQQRIDNMQQRVDNMQQRVDNNAKYIIQKP